jgi:hypothetical protein
MRSPSQALLSTLVASLVCDEQRGDADSTEEEDSPLEFGGVEIIVNDAVDHAHAVYPHFSDKPTCAYAASNGNHTHAVYPHLNDKPHNSYAASHVNHAHAVYPHLDDEPNRLGYSHAAYPAYRVYPHFGDRPDEDSGHAHASYPVFEENFGGLIGDIAKDGASIEHSSMEIISDEFDVKEFVVHTKSDGMTGEPAPKPPYPVFGESFGGLIGDTHKEDTSIEHHGVEIIASNGGDHCFYMFPHFSDEPRSSYVASRVNHAHAAYPHFDGEPPACVYPHMLDEHSSHDRTSYPTFGDNFCGLTGEIVKDDAVVEHPSMEIISDEPDGNDSYAHIKSDGMKGEKVLGAHDVYPGGMHVKANEEPIIEHHRTGNIISSVGDHPFHMYPNPGEGESDDTFAALAPSPSSGMSIGSLKSGTMDEDNITKHFVADTISLGGGDIGNAAIVGAHGQRQMLGGENTERLLGDVVDGKADNGDHVGKTARRSEALTAATSEDMRSVAFKARPVSNDGPSDKRKDVSDLVAAFLSLPEEEILRVMSLAISSYGSNAHLGTQQQKCTGCGATGELFHSHRHFPVLMAAAS